MKPLSIITLLLTFVVIILGAYTRLQDAGLGCPDWPGCYGTLTVPSGEEQINEAQVKYPAIPFDKSKAWTEVIHRSMAGTLGLLIFAMTIINILHSRRHKTKISLVLITASIVVIFQALLGMWTVTLKLLPQVVTAHLFGGLLTLSLIFWHFLQLRDNSAHRGVAMQYFNDHLVRQRQNFGNNFNKIKLFAYIGLALVIGQIFLGGWVSTNYAALSCPDFPLCYGEWLPQMDLAAGFDIFHPIGINYEGGVLDKDARVAIHFMHRLGALILVTYWLLFYGIVRVKNIALQNELSLIMAILVIQLILGITNVLGGLPLIIATAHNGVAALLLLSVLLLLFNLYRHKL